MRGIVADAMIAPGRYHPVLDRTARIRVNEQKARKLVSMGERGAGISRVLGRLHRQVRPATAARREDYFQFRDLPSAIHRIAVSSRRVRVADVLASVIHSMYSRRWLGGN